MSVLEREVARAVTGNLTNCFGIFSFNFLVFESFKPRNVFAIFYNNKCFRRVEITAMRA